MREETAHRSRPVRVGLWGDDEIVVLGLDEMLSRFSERVEVVHLSAGVTPQPEPDVVLFVSSGRWSQDDAALRRLVQQSASRVVVYRWDHYPEEVASRSGAAGFLHQALGAEEVVGTLLAVGDGGATADAADPEDPERPVTWPGQAHGLTQREAEMVGLITRGLSNEQIARHSYLSLNTVKTHIRTAYAKIGVSSRAQTVAWGYRHGFGPVDTGT